jgi:hypothetical protein
MRIHGYLSQGDVYTILRLLARTRSSGLLRLHAEDREATLAVHGGHILRASICSGPSLGEALVMSGAVDPAAIEDALQVQSWVAPRRRLGSILVERGVVEQPRVSAALTEGIRDVILLAATWASGSYEFEPRIGVDWDATFGGVAIEALVPDFESRRCVPRGH